jgi:hypothetical protein
VARGGIDHAELYRAPDIDGVAACANHVSAAARAFQRQREGPADQPDANHRDAAERCHSGRI